jgi:hypothetical protein
MKKAQAAVMYRYSIVTFLDVLGFRSLVANESADHISSILKKMRTYAGRDNVEEDDDPYLPTISTFSDCVVRTNFSDSEANVEYQIGLLFFELLALLHAQCQLIDSGVVVRGGVAFGDIVHDEDSVFGPAMVDAYELESKKAVYPRIVISPEWLKALKTNPLICSQDDTLQAYTKQIRKLIRKDQDGFYFVDYIRAIQSELDDPEVDYIRFLDRHGSLVRKHLKENIGQAKIFEKYEWLSKYHDERIHELDEKFLEYYGFTKSELLTGDV